LPDRESEIFLIPGLDIISEKQKLLIRRRRLSSEIKVSIDGRLIHGQQI